MFVGHYCLNRTKKTADCNINDIIQYVITECVAHNPKMTFNVASNVLKYTKNQLCDHTHTPFSARLAQFVWWHRNVILCHKIKCIYSNGVGDAEVWGDFDDGK